MVSSHIVHNRAPWVGGNGGGIDSDTLGPREADRQRGLSQRLGRQRRRGRGVDRTASCSIERSTIASNKAAQAGGVMTFGPTVRIVESTISSNLASAGPGVEGDGGGIYVGASGRVELTNSTLANNGAYTSGGGIFSDAGSNATISFSTIVRNRADADHANGGTTGGVHLRTQGVQVAAGRASPTPCSRSTSRQRRGHRLRRDRLPRDRREPDLHRQPGQLLERPRRSSRPTRGWARWPATAGRRHGRAALRQPGDRRGRGQGARSTTSAA